jgi:hypothetical protein
MKTDTKELAAELRRIADGILFGRPALVANQAADRLEELERDLEQDRELADRLAGVLLSYHHDLLAGEDMQWLPEHDKSLTAWKEARNDT